MNKIDALIECLKGKKVYPVGKVDSVYISWDGNKFISHDKILPCPADFSLAGYNNADWRIVTELVSFDEAWKAYEQGKTIKSNRGREWVKANELKCEDYSNNNSFSRNEIRGQWQILND